MAKVQREVTFKPCTYNGIAFAQDEILLNGRRIGYVGHGHGENANLIAPVDDETRQVIFNAVAVHRGTAPNRVCTAPQIQDEADTDVESFDE